MLSDGRLNTGENVDQPDALMLKIARQSSNSRNDNIGKDYRKNASFAPHLEQHGAECMHKGHSM